MMGFRTTALFFLLALSPGTTTSYINCAEATWQKLRPRDGTGMTVAQVEPSSPAEPSGSARSAGAALSSVAASSASSNNSWSRSLGLVARIAGRLIPFAVVLSAAPQAPTLAAASSSVSAPPTELRVVISSLANDDDFYPCPMPLDPEHVRLFQMLGGKQNVMFLSNCPEEAKDRAKGEAYWAEQLLESVPDAWDRQSVGAIQDFLKQNPQLMVQPSRERKIVVKVLLEDHKGYVAQTVLGNQLDARELAAKGGTGLQRVLEPTIRAILKQLAEAMGVVIEEHGDEDAALRSLFVRVDLMMLTCRYADRGVPAQWYPRLENDLERDVGYGVLTSVGVFELPFDESSVRWEADQRELYQLTTWRHFRSSGCRARELEENLLHFLGMSRQQLRILEPNEAGSAPECANTSDQRWRHFLEYRTLANRMRNFFRR